MPLDLYLAFVVAAAVVLAVPGPTILLVVATALGRGTGAALRSVIGVAAGDALAVTVSLAGLGALLAASAAAFTVLKWAGALYLIYLGVQAWRHAGAHADDSAPPPTDGTIRKAFVVTALNPKSIAFFVAFLPQFVDPAAPAGPQWLLLGTTFVVLATVNGIAYALLAGRLRRLFAGVTARRRLDRAGGTALIGAGVLTASLERT